MLGLFRVWWWTYIDIFYNRRIPYINATLDKVRPAVIGYLSWFIYWILGSHWFTLGVFDIAMALYIAKYIYIYIHNPILWEFLRYALRLHLLFSLFGDKSNTSMDMSGSGRIPPLPNVLVYLLSYNLVAAAGTERWLTWEKQESGAGMIWPSNLAPKIQSSYPLVRSNSSVVERLREK